LGGIAGRGSQICFSRSKSSENVVRMTPSGHATAVRYFVPLKDSYSALKTRFRITSMLKFSKKKKSSRARARTFSLNRPSPPASECRM
jgi:hypothetical protein